MPVSEFRAAAALCVRAVVCCCAVICLYMNIQNIAACDARRRVQDDDVTYIGPFRVQGPLHQQRPFVLTRRKYRSAVGLLFEAQPQACTPLFRQVPGHRSILATRLIASSCPRNGPVHLDKAGNSRLCWRRNRPAVTIAVSHRPVLRSAQVLSGISRCAFLRLS